MPEEVEREIRRRGGALRYRTLKLPDGRYLHVAVTRRPGPRGGRTIATGEPKEPKGMAEGGVVTSAGWRFLTVVGTLESPGGRAVWRGPDGRIYTAVLDEDGEPLVGADGIPMGARPAPPAIARAYEEG